MSYFNNHISKQFHIDITEAPQDYYPVLKDSITENKNVCHFCDWRSNCKATVCSCMADKRKDKQSVYFKKLGA